MSGNVTAAMNPNLNPGTAYTAQQAVTASAVALPDYRLANGFVLTAATSNAGDVLVGSTSAVTTAIDGSGTGYRLVPGQSISFGVTTPAALWIIGTASDVVYLAGN